MAAATAAGAGCVYAPLALYKGIVYYAFGEKKAGVGHYCRPVCNRSPIDNRCTPCLSGAAGRDEPSQCGALQAQFQVIAIPRVASPSGRLTWGYAWCGPPGRTWPICLIDCLLSRTDRTDQTDQTDRTDRTDRFDPSDRSDPAAKTCRKRCSQKSLESVNQSPESKVSFPTVPKVPIVPAMSRET